MEHFPTDNADVSLTKVSGWLVAMTETTLIHLIDPKTLETSHSLDIFNAPFCGKFEPRKHKEN